MPGMPDAWFRIPDVDCQSLGIRNQGSGIGGWTSLEGYQMPDSGEKFRAFESSNKKIV